MGILGTKAELLIPLVLAGFVAGCVETAAPTRVSMGAAPGKTAIETLATMPPADVRKVFGRYADPALPRNKAGELELFTGAGDMDEMPMIKAAAANICTSIEMKLTKAEELPRDQNGVRKIRILCK